ncbi:hypothetical protein [Rhodoferax sp. UBA5149]|uniref:hypothetical protein n=1 Tax=Rhodoferax sp. UBA5149 TaxID=1947379 RepID=UPI0025FA23B0|nr:hypothetical protein [Rhodoferax sp. UBA5149]
MKFIQKMTLALTGIALAASNLVATQTTLRNASYDVAREFVAKLFRNVPVLAKGGRDATTHKLPAQRFQELDLQTGETLVLTPRKARVFVA